jgi:REP element-mobilizing transposase RayT
MVETEWRRTGELRANVVLDEYVVMPNHFHGILLVKDDGRGTARGAPTTVERFSRPTEGSVPTIVRSFKSAVTKAVNRARQTPGARVWQRNYYEHVIRYEESLSEIRGYIACNPARWAFERENARGAGAEYLRRSSGNL